jgi:ferredoxin
MFIAIDADKCMGHGRCYTVAPDLLTFDDEGFVAERGRCWELQPDQEAAAAEAANSCPEQAITVSEEPVALP